MNDPQAEKTSQPPVEPVVPEPPPKSEPPPPAQPAVRKVKRPAPQERRDFFSDAMKEVLSPFAGVLERKINPLLASIEAIPDKAQDFANIDKKAAQALDQIHSRATKSLSLPVKTQRTPIERYLRPPGAMAPGEFESVCSRCAKCVEACPANAIQLDPNHLTADGFPYIVPGDQPCVVCDELACMPSCPTGALKVLDKLQINMGTAKVDHSLCLRDRGENCTLCIDVCPVENGDGLRAITASPITGKVIVRKNICIGCGLCENRCPTHPAAIAIQPYKNPLDPIIA